MKRILLLCTISVVFLYGCEKNFLDRQPLAQLNEEILANEQGLNALLVSAYSMLDGYHGEWELGIGSPWFSAASNWAYGDVASDDSYKGNDEQNQAQLSLIEIFGHDASNDYFAGKWAACYEGISRANEVLQVLKRAEETLSPEQALQVEAEARFLRGHFHLEAKKMWGNVPFISHETQDSLISNTREIWSEIESDFFFAYEQLPIVQDEPGRASKYAAAAFLAKAHLFQQDYTAAKPLLDEIIDDGPYSLAPCFHDNFTLAGNNNEESIFAVQHSVNDGTDGENGNFGDALNFPYAGGPGQCCGFNAPSQNLVNAYQVDQNGLPLLDNFNRQDVGNDEGKRSTDPFNPHTGALDPRLDWTVGRRGIPYLDWGDHPGNDWIRDQTFSGPYSPKKHAFYAADEGTASTASGWAKGANAINTKLIRFADVLLWRAEVAVEEADFETARLLVNQVRIRSKNGCYVTTDNGVLAANYKIAEYPAGAPFDSQENARKAVRFERRLELALEGHRFFDLVRWGIAEEVMQAYFATEKNKRIYLFAADFVKGKHEYFPIPQREIDASGQNDQLNLLQNPGY